MWKMYINPINVPPLGVNNYYPHGQVNLELPQFEGGMASPPCKSRRLRMNKAWGYWVKLLLHFLHSFSSFHNNIFIIFRVTIPLPDTLT